jgi:hypothetical protein
VTQQCCARMLMLMVVMVMQYFGISFPCSKP